MTLPRPVVCGETAMLTRRCSERRFFMRPSPKTNQILLFCLAVGAERYGMAIHWFCFMSNHYHAVETDPLGNRPEFCRWFQEFVAKHINTELGRWENLWAPEPTSVVALSDDDAQLGKTVYTLCNPVDAVLVKTGDQWPGVRSSPSQFGTTVSGFLPSPSSLSNSQALSLVGRLPPATSLLASRL